MSFNILGTGSALPSQTVCNEDLCGFLDTSDEWILSRTGIRERRVLNGETLTDLAIRAARAALQDAGVAAASLDRILCATVQGDYRTPSMACLVQEALGAVCPAMDVNAACSGFLYALDLARAYFAGGGVEKILIVCAEGMSKLIDWTDRSTCVLFGDGAGAVVLERGDNLLYIRLTAAGSDRILSIPACREANPFCADRQPETTLRMNGQQVYRFAVDAVSGGVQQALAETGLAAEDIDYFLLHQANIRILQVVRERLGLPEEKFPVNVDRLGNTSSASIPMLLDEMNRAGRLKPGNILFFCAFGGGLTTGAAMIRWGRL